MSPFRIIEHRILCQHIREYPQATSGSQNTELQLAVKQYVPISNPNPKEGDVTVIGAHANGFPKELYEPLWEDLYAQSKTHGFTIRGIWIADVAHQGESGILNEHLLGNDPGWYDHSRDLLHLINVKRDDMPRPIVGVGHSLGAAQLTNLAYMHPRLFTTLVLIDPAIQLYPSVAPGQGLDPARLSTFRRDLWPSREMAAQEFRNSSFYKAWDTRVLDRWIQYGLRETPTLLHHSEPESEQSFQVTLTTPFHQEVQTFNRSNYEGYGHQGKPVNYRTHADLNPDLPSVYPFYRAEPAQVFLRLQELRPSTFYVFGKDSAMSKADAQNAKMRRTGAGVGGSGGVVEGRVESVTIPDVGHLVPMESPGQTALQVAQWVGREWKRWQQEEETRRRAWETRSAADKQKIDDRWRKAMGGPYPRRRQKL
ncbi:uncharacterized protein Z520_02702 [Fonsecaea multimorphosa CBS 102226]|uniref:AB hydrolase-1 domain-containing protein n=1 Tax=Fonsecaea multimorphosa CBS 102226 TaxID=1442371 RepID=A0A0D2KD66_9EURO|nr:uncharacterized protein Z520_02702 [Fonsecaea multimorphosa CBS 102226]KIY01150.1 hypothetical protein Z520_02702 [Fonsecaea multimorphosa CBS 102226]OAL28766.1 hypothetical protein AYO22_02631 [Fonsecaea multimorphosa]